MKTKMRFSAAIDLDVTNSAGDGAVKVNTTTIVAGGPIAVTSFTVTMPGG